MHESETFWKDNEINVHVHKIHALQGLPKHIYLNDV